MAQIGRTGSGSEIGRGFIYIYCRNLSDRLTGSMWITAENVDKTVDNSVDNFAAAG